MVLVLENALVRTALVTLEERFPPVVIEAAGRVLSERIAGRTVGEIRAGVRDSLLASMGPAARCARQLAREGRELFAELEAEELSLQGVANVLDQPEFSQPKLLKALLRFIESPRTIRETLHRLDEQSQGDLGVWIGGENPLGDLHPFGLVLLRCDLDGRDGLMAVLGPRRMPYQRAFGGLDVLQRSLQALS
jgi:heat-inducible transcriptional repressor